MNPDGDADYPMPQELAQRDPLEAALKAAENGRESHVQWRDWIEHWESCSHCQARHPAHPAEGDGGSRSFHERWIAAYDVIIGQLLTHRSLMGELAVARNRSLDMRASPDQLTQSHGAVLLALIERLERECGGVVPWRTAAAGEP